MKTEDIIILGVGAYLASGMLLRTAYNVLKETNSTVQNVQATPERLIESAVSAPAAVINEVLSSMGVAKPSGTISATQWDARSHPTGTYVSSPIKTRRIVDEVTGGVYSEVWETVGNTQYGYLVL